tara:strand:+ start:3596 stop:3697 length:102 start_codon:yes stop_codon:yes gene_type:complete
MSKTFFQKLSELKTVKKEAPKAKKTSSKKKIEE